MVFFCSGKSHCICTALNAMTDYFSPFPNNNELYDLIYLNLALWLPILLYYSEVIYLCISNILFICLDSI